MAGKDASLIAYQKVLDRVTATVRYFCPCSDFKELEKMAATLLNNSSSSLKELGVIFRSWKCLKPRGENWAHVVAKFNLVNICKLVINYVERIAENEIAEDIKSRDDKVKTPLHYAVLNESPIFDIFLYQVGVNINVTDSAGNTPLHLCKLTDTRKINLLLTFGANYSGLQDQNGNIFLSSSSKARKLVLKWLKECGPLIARSLHVVLTEKSKPGALWSIAEEQYDAVLSQILQRVLTEVICQEQDRDINNFYRDWIINKGSNGNLLLLQIWEKSELDKNAFVKSYPLILRLLSKAPDDDKAKIDLYCYDNLDVKCRLLIRDDIFDLFATEMDAAFLLKESITSEFFFVIFLSMLDFATDIAVTYQYWYWDDILKDYPLNNTVCELIKPQNASLVCNIHNISPSVPFWYSLITGGHAKHLVIVTHVALADADAPEAKCICEGDMCNDHKMFGMTSGCPVCPANPSNGDKGGSISSP